MKRSFLAPLVGIIAILLTPPAPQVRAAENDNKEEVKTLPLKSIYSTMDFKDVKEGLDDSCKQEFEELRERLFDLGASNVFLARGDDIRSAIWGTWSVIRAGVSANTPARLSPGDAKSAQYWMVVYFGRGGSGPTPKWCVKGVEQQGNRVRLTYSRPKEIALNSDDHAYLYWVPLEQVKKGACILELFDEDDREVTLLRRVTIR